MRIDRTHLKNFKLFEDFSLDLHPEFTLLIGENGSGKTSLLESLAIACGIWLYEVPDVKISNSRIPLHDHHIRLASQMKGDRMQFVPSLECTVSAWGELFQGSEQQQWTQEIRFGKKSKIQLKEARKLISDRLRDVAEGKDLLLPVIAYYGAGRAWLPSNDRAPRRPIANGPKSRWEAFNDCLNERIQIADLQKWFADEAIERGNRNGEFRPGFDIVKQAILGCIPAAQDAWYDSDREDIAISIDGKSQPFSNISAGQRAMLALVADIAIKCVTQNNFLVPADGLRLDDDPVPSVLRETPGVVLIDEIDVHLHPRWQRRVIEDLRRTFPKIQFVATTHSPQVIGELEPASIRLLDQGGQIPRQSFGMDSNWILDVLMNAEDQNKQVGKDIEEVFSLIGVKEAGTAKQKLQELRERINGSSEEIEKAEALIERVRILGK